MSIGVTFTIRAATATNNVSHSYSYNASPTPDEETFGDTRFYDSYDLSGGLTSGEYNGTTADGSIVRNETIVAGDTPVPQG